MKKRFLSLLLAVLLVLGALPLPALASGMPALAAGEAEFADFFTGLADTLAAENDGAYPYTVDTETGDGPWLKSGNAGMGSTEPAVTLTFQQAAALTFTWKVDSEERYDGMLVKNGSKTLYTYSASAYGGDAGAVTGCSGKKGGTATVNAQAGDVVTIAYRKDSSGNSGSDCLWLKDFQISLPSQVIFHANNGTGDTKAQGIFGTGDLEANSFSYAGHIFKGWATGESGPVVYEDGGEITITENTDLYAVWAAVYPLSFTVAPEDAAFGVSQVTEGSPVLLTPDSGTKYTYTVENGDYIWAASAFGYEDGGAQVTVNGGPQTVEVSLKKNPAHEITFIYDSHEGEVENGSLTVSTADGAHTLFPAAEGGLVYSLPVGYDYSWTFKSANFAKQSGVISLSGQTTAGTASVTVPMVVKTAWGGADDIAEPAQTDGVYQIGSGAELAWLARQVNARDPKLNAVLTRNIDLGGEEWTPIGQAYATRYAGVFDGQGFTVTGLRITGSATGNYGLFGYVEDGTVKNLTVEGEISLTGSGGSSYGIAGIAGQLSGTSGSIENCVNKAAVSGGQNTGGVVGYVSSGYSTASKAIRRCANLGAVSASENNAGGIVGSISGQVTLENSYNTGAVNGGGWRSGGITAYLSSSYAAVRNCYTAGAVTGSRDVNPAFGSKSSGTVESGSVYYLSDGSTADANATAKTEAEMKASDFLLLLGPDFQRDPAASPVNRGYPILTFQDPTPKYDVTVTLSVEEASLALTDAQGEAVPPVSARSGVFRYRLPDGEYFYTAAAFGYEEAHGSITVTGGEAAEAVTLREAARRRVAFSVVPSSAPAQITVRYTADGRTVPAQSAGAYSLPSGEYSYAVKAKGYAKVTGSFTVNGKETGTQTVSVTLAPSAQWDGESREEVSPNGDGVYEIGDGAELAWFADAVNSGAGANYSAVLTDDIDLGGEAWIPIGSGAKPFGGSFDGGGFTVSGLAVSGINYAGLFGYLKGTSAQNAEVKNLVVRGTVSGTDDVGGVAGRADYAVFENCGNEAAVSGGSNAAGIVGRQFSYGSPLHITGCYNAGAVSGARAGGILAYINDEAEISRCYNTGEIAGTGYAGGIRGQAGSMIGTITGCYHAGTVTGSTSGPIQAGGSEISGSYYLGESGSGAMTLAAMQAELLEKLGEGWKTVPGVNQELPLLAWQKVEEPAGELVLAENVEFSRELAPSSDEEEPLDVPTPVLSWDAVEGARGYVVALWQCRRVWQELTAEEKAEFDAEADPVRKIMLIDSDALIAAMSPEQKAALAPYEDELAQWKALANQATTLAEFREADKKLQEAQRSRDAFLAGEIEKGGLPLGHYGFELEQAGTIPDISGTSCDCAERLSAMEEGVYFATVSAVDENGKFSLPETEYVQENVYGLQNPYNRMKPVTGLAWNGTTAVWEGKSGFIASEYYILDLYTVSEGSYTLSRRFLASGDTTSAPLGNVFAAGTSYAFTVTAVPDGFFLTDSLPSGYSPVYTPTSQNPEEKEWVDISSAEDWLALANVEDVPSAGAGSESLQAIAWKKNYRLTEDLDFSGLSAAGQSKTKSIGNVTNRFLGELDGQGHKITGLTLSNLDSGLFAYIGSTGYVHDLAVENANVLFADNAAVLAHNNFGTIEGCAVINCNITADTGAVLGGMVSRNYGVIRKSYVQGGTLTSNSVTATGHAGFVGSNEENALIESCWSSMNVSTQSEYSGGFAGLGYGGTIRNCFALGDVSARGYSGGFLGRSVFSGNIYENCYAAGVVTVTGDEGNGFTGGNQPDSGFQYDQSDGVRNCYYNRATASSHDYGAKGRTLEQMRTEDFLNALGLVDVVWARSGEKNTGLPYLVGIPVPEPPETEQLTVSILLAGYDKAEYRFYPMGEKLSVTMESSGNTRLVDLMDAAAEQGLLSYSFDTTPNFGRYIRTINGHSVDSPDGWMFTVNGRLSNVSASLAAVKNGDEILWFEGTTENRFLPPTEEELSGEEEKWIEINTKEQLLALTKPGADLSANYRLTAGFDLSGINFPGIGTAAAPFTGVFDGQGHTISHVTVAGSSQYAGFFGVLRGATVKNLNLTECSVSGGSKVGCLAGWVQVVLDQSDAGKQVACLIGNCTVSGTVSGTAQAGGLIGLNDGAYDEETMFSVSSSVDKCTADVAVTGTDSAVGGLVGENNGVITKSSAFGAVTAENASAAGGLAGRSYNGSIYDSHAEGTVIGKSTVGGFVGSSSGTIRNCYSLGDVSGESYTGGFSGSLSAAENVISAGQVTVTGSSGTGYHGGFAGILNGAITGVENQITVRNAYGNCTQPDGTQINLIGNGTDYASEAQKEVLAQMTLTTRAATGAKLYEMFGVDLPLSEELKREAEKYAESVKVDAAPGEAISLLKVGEAPGAGITVSYEASGEFLTGGSDLTLGKANDTAATKAVRVLVTLTDPQGNFCHKTVTVLLPADASAVSGLMDTIAASYTESSDGWTVMDMAVYAGLPGKTAKTSETAWQNALNLLVSEAGSSSASAGDRARLEIVLRAMGVDSTQLYPANSNSRIDNAQKLAGMQLISGGYYAAPWILLAARQGNVVLSKTQINGLLELLSANVGEGLFGYTWQGAAYSDPDTAGAALAALAEYMEEYETARELIEKIRAAVPAAFSETGSLGSANSDAMMILGLLALGEDPADYCSADSGASLVDGLLSYVNPETDRFQFEGDDNSLATEQAFRALAALAKAEALPEGTPYNFYDFSETSVEPGRATGEGELEKPVEPAPGNPEITVTVTIRGDTGDWLREKAVSVRQGSTVYHAFLKALEDSGITQAGAEKGYVRSMTKDGVTLAEFTGGKNSGWLYQVNRVLPKVGITSCPVSAGDAILFYYTEDWTKDPAAGTGFSPAEPGELPFTDIAGHWGTDAIRYVYENRLMVGDSATRFAPDAPLSRAMLVAVLWRLEGSPAPKEKSGFTDVPANKWYTEAVAWARENEIVAGLTETSFAPGANVTREQAAAILRRFAAYKNFDVSGRAGLTSYSDSGKISRWAREDVAWAVKEGLLSGRTASTLVPGGRLTRAEAASILMRFCKKYKILQVGQ